MLTKDEITEIISKYVYPHSFHVYGILDAAEAIAEQLTPAHLMSHFVGPVHSGTTQSYRVPHTDGTRRSVWIKADGATACWDPDTWDRTADPPLVICSDSSDGTTCLHVEAARLYRARLAKTDIRETNT